MKRTLGMTSLRKEGRDLMSGAGNMKHDSKKRSNGRNENLAQLNDTLGIGHKKKACVKE